MAKKRAEEGAVETADSVLALLAELDKRVDGVSYAADKGEELLVGIPLPAFSLMYLMDINVLPLSKVIGIAGAAQSYKSALGFEIQSWFMESGGYGVMVECEGRKYSLPLIRSIMGEEASRTKFRITPVGTIEEAQKVMTSTVGLYQENAAWKKIPCAMTLDSMTGVDTDASTEKVMEKDGHASQDFSRMALSWTKFLRPFAGSLTEIPLTTIIINHLKTKIDANPRPGAPPGKTTPGGDAQRFYSAIYLYLNKAGHSERKSYLHPELGRIDRFQEIRSLKIKCDKSSLGTDGRDITVDLVWYFDEHDNQITYFDWESSTVTLLMELQGRTDSSQPGRKLSDIVDIREERTYNMTVYSSTILGKEKVEAHELGKAIHANPELMAELQRFFHIKQSKLWSGEMPKLSK